MAFFYRLSFAFLLIASSLVSTAQVSFDSQEELEAAANSFFDEGAYTKAKPLFSQLLSKDALDPNFNYRFGVCVMYTEADPLKPLPYIEGGASTNGVNKEAYYFLGKAYQFNYRFEDAHKAFQKAKDAGYSKAGVDLSRNIEESINGKVLFNSAINFEPAQNKEVLESEFYRPYDFRKLKGKVIPMPPSFKTKYDQKNLLGTVVYTPSNSNVLVYASYGEDGANAKDLYKVNRLPNGEWALPQRLPDNINTKYDEDFAFFDDASKTLFFASKGHNSMGGYDVFSSNYNGNDNSWSTPINLQYPVNSPFDDFLYVSDPNGKLAFFTTARNTTEGKLRVMKTMLYNPDQVELSVVEGTFTDKTDSLYNYASLTVLDPISNQVIGKYRTNQKTGKYVLVLPPQNDYSMDVGPKEANGFKFDLDVPKNQSVRPLQQGIVYDASAENGTVTLTNYFDATGKPDSLALAESKPINEVVEKMVAMAQPDNVLASSKEPEIADVGTEVENGTGLAKEQAAQKLEEGKLLAEMKAAEALAKSKAEEEEKARLAAEEAKKLEEQKAADLAAQQLEEEKLLAEMEAAEALAKSKAEEEEKARLAAEEAKKLEEQKAADLAAQQLEEEKLLAEMKAAEALAKSKAEEEKSRIAVKEAKKLEEQKAADLAAQQLEEEKLLAETKAAEALAKSKIEEEEKARVAAEQAKKLEEQEAAELTAKKLEEEQRLAILEAEKEMKAQLAQEELERNLAIKEATRRDSIAQAEIALLEETNRQKLYEDSLLSVQRQEAIAEKERLEEISKEVELAKQNALRDSAEQMAIREEELLVESTGSFDDLLKEMADKEAELLEEQGLAEESLDKTSNKPLEEPETAINNIQVDEEKVEPEVVNDTAKSSEGQTLSEADLFLQTIAKLEAQKAEQQRLIDAENTELAERKKQNQSIEIRDTSDLADANETVIETAASGAEKDSSSAKKIAKEDLVLVEEEIAALKSDANPQEYLDALNEIEEQIAADKASRNDKDYSLKPLPSQPATGVDAVLQERIDADRIALAEHQKIAREKEKALKEEMQRDKGVLEGADQALINELGAIDNEVDLLQDELTINTKSGNKLKVGETAQVEPLETENIESDLQSEIELEVASDMVEEETKGKTELVKSDEPVQPELETSVEAQESIEKTGTIDEDLVAKAMEEMDALLAESDTQSEVVNIDKAVVETEAPTPTKEEQVEEQILVAQADEEIETLIAETAEEELISPTTEKEITEPEFVQTETEPIVMEPEVEVALDSQANKSEESAEELVSEVIEVALPAERVVTVGTIPFLEATIRNPEKSKPSFDKIEDKSQRRMIKRMRAEDVGRLAVLKNIKNEKIDAAGDARTVEAIQKNLRNQDVLANSSQNAREEYIRPKFDKSHLKQREDVFYKLEFSIKSGNVSETISEAMTPEQAMNFAMPEFEMVSDLYFTFADANSGLREYQGRGFDSVRLVPYLKGAPTTLSIVEQIPFID